MSERIYPSLPPTVFINACFFLQLLSLSTPEKLEAHRNLFALNVIAFVILTTINLIKIITEKRYLPAVILYKNKIKIRPEERQRTYKEILLNQIEKIHFDRATFCLTIHLKNEASICANLKSIRENKIYRLLRLIREGYGAIYRNE